MEVQVVEEQVTWLALVSQGSEELDENLFVYVLGTGFDRYNIAGDIGACDCRYRLKGQLRFHQLRWSNFFVSPHSVLLEPRSKHGFICEDYVATVLNDLYHLWQDIK